MTIDLLTLIPRCHEAAKAKGFWDVTPNPGQQLMLVISELAEALEADRKGPTKQGLAAYLLEAARMKADGWVTLGSDDPDFHPEEFQYKVKDTVGDELADAYIRLCDFAGGFELDLEEVASQHELLECPENFAEALLGITAIVVMTDYELDARERCIGMALAHIEALCEQRGIDLATHIDLKLRYNATRPVRHGKSY